MTWIISGFADEAGPTTREQIDALTRDGLTHIDLRAVEGANITALDPAVARTVRQQLDEAGIAVNMFGSPIGKIDIADDIASDVERLRHLGEMARIFDCKAVRIFSYYNKAGQPHDRWQAASIDRLKTLRDEADKLDLVLYHENESDIFGDRSDDVLALAPLRDGERFKLIYDFANYIRTGERGLDTWAKFRDKTDALHFKDQKKNGEHVPIGQGDTDAAAILEDAAAMGWTGPCTLEPHLVHSAAVLATGASGTGSQSLKDLGPAECFHVAAAEARRLLDRIGVAYR
ncbi:MAG: TIM barrel protein [Phycisphaeraceae bacterium]